MIFSCLRNVILSGKTQTSNNKLKTRWSGYCKDKLFGGYKRGYCLLTAAGKYLTEHTLKVI